MFNKIKGGIFGVAVGDALGCTTEFMTPKEIQLKFGLHKEITGGGPFHFNKGEVTDDTDMTLCVARGIIKNKEKPIESIGENFIKWRDSHPKDIGNTVDTAIGLYAGDWEESSKKTHQLLGGKSGGNGSLMRTLPIALAYNDPNKIIRLSRSVSKLTHWDEKASNACILYNRIAFHLINGRELKEAIFSETEGTGYGSSLKLEPFDPPNAYVVNTLKWVLHILYQTDSFEEVVVRAANAGYDADTTGAIAGGLAGIYYGFENIPKRFIEALLIKEELEEISKKIFELRNEQ